MTHQWRIPAILCLSIVFGAPVLGELLSSPEDLVSAGARYLAALALAWVGVTAIARLIERFDHHNRVLEHEELAEAMAVRDAEQAEAARLAQLDRARAAGLDDADEEAGVPA